MSMIGDNVQTIDYAKEEIQRLGQDYGNFIATVEDLTVEAEAIPEKIADAETKGVVASLIKRMRDAAKRIEGVREVEKTPHLRRGQAVDQFGHCRRQVRRSGHRGRGQPGQQRAARKPAGRAGQHHGRCSVNCMTLVFPVAKAASQ